LRSLAFRDPRAGGPRESPERVSAPRVTRELVFRYGKPDTTVYSIESAGTAARDVGQAFSQGLPRRHRYQGAGAGSRSLSPTAVADPEPLPDSLLRERVATEELTLRRSSWVE